MECGFDGRELNSYDFKERGYIKSRHKLFINKLNFIFESVEVFGVGKNRTYILNRRRELYTEEEAIKITRNYGYNGNEFNTLHWKEKGFLYQNTTLIKKLKSIYNKVDILGESNNRIYYLDDKKDDIVINHNFNKSKPKSVKKSKPTTKKTIESEKVVSAQEQRKINEAKQTFIEEFFHYNTFSYREDDKKHMLVDINFDASRLELKRAIKSLYKKYNRIFKWDEFISIIMLLVVEAVHDFKPNTKNFKWDEVNQVGSNSNLILNKFVYNSYINQIKDYSYKAQDKIRTSTRVKENGKTVKKIAIIENQNDSIDITASLDDGDTNVIQTIGNERKYGYQNSLYHPNQFLHWFYTNTDKILAQSQIEFINVMQKYFHEEGSEYTKPYSQDPSQPYKDSTRRNRMNRIRTKVNDLWEKELEENNEITLLQVKKESDLQLLNELISIVYNSKFDDVSELNERISNYIYIQLNNDSNTVLSDLLHDELEVNELIHMNKCFHQGFSIGNRLIYKIVSLVENKIERLEKFDTSKSDGRLKSNLGWTKEDHQRYSDYYDDFTKPSIIKVYDLKTNKLLRNEKYVPKRKNYIVQKLDTYGLRHNVGELEVGID